MLHSCTKYLGGHNDLLAGVVVGPTRLVSLVRDVRGVLGGVSIRTPRFCSLRGLKTLALRVERQNATALAIARWLEAQPEVERVFYPGLPSHPDHAIAARQMTRLRRRGELRRPRRTSTRRPRRSTRASSRPSRRRSAASRR